jgi:intracellular multiplication protein IcmP
MSEGKKRDPLVDWLIIGAGVALAYFGLGYAFGDKIAYAWWWWQGLKGEVIQLFFSFDLLSELLKIMGQERNWKQVTIFQSWQVADIVGSYWRWVFIPGIAYWAWHISKQNPLHNLRHRHSMDTLIKSEVAIWPHVQPIVSLNLINEPTDKGAWASAQNPVEYAKDHHLLKEGTELDKEKAEKVFVSQLSKVWAGVNQLDPVTKAFFAIFAAHGNWDEKDPKYKSGKSDARKGINRLASSYFQNPKKLDLSWADEMAKKHFEHPAVQEITSRHAYTHTVMMSLLEYARRNGVLPSSEFFWLRPVDRTLWYALNNVGRNVAWTEVAGIYGHWLAEKIVDAPLVRPYVQKAVEAFADALKNIKLKPVRKTT